MNELRAHAASLTRGALLGTLVGLLCGAASSLFLWLLDVATQTRQAHPAWVYALPLAGLCLGWLYERFGASIAGGNNLVLDTMHVGGPTLPLRMAPMVLLGTVATHLFGGSAGREGTAVQMGASLADALASRLQASPETRQRLLAAGVAGGFGSVFGTPVAGAVFAMEVGTLGRVDLAAMVPAVTASVVGDLVCRALGTTHAHYPTLSPLPLGAPLLLKWVLFGAAIAAAAWVFIELTHGLKAFSTRHLRRLPLRMAAGGVAVVVLWRLTGTDAYLGLGVEVIVRAFHDPHLGAWVFALKLLFTAVTLGAGFLGGEVTPLFFVGATLGSALGRCLGVPIEMGAAVGLAAVFAAASNTPIALVLMVTELVGAQVLPHALVVCTVAYVLVGHRSIYVSQRVAHRKDGGALDPPQPLPALTRRAGVPPPSETAPTNPPTRSEGR